MNPWHDVDRGSPEQFNAIVEISAGRRNKYEMDKETGLLKLDRVIFSSVMYPADYGFIPQSYWEDNDPIDVLIISRYPLEPLCIAPVRPIGVMQMIDNEEEDSKIIAVIASDPKFDDVRDLDDLDVHFMKEIKHFFEIYKELQNKKVKVENFLGREEAKKLIQKSFDMYDAKFADKKFSGMNK